MDQGVTGQIQPGGPAHSALAAEGVLTAPSTGRRPWGAWLYYALMAIVFLGALALRLPHLDQRPMHTDEAVHAFKLGELLDQGTYLYNPHEYHGPTLYYFTLPLLWLKGIHAYSQIPSETLLRLVPALFGAGLVLLLLLLADGLGRAAAFCAAVLTALSPAMVFYSRYYIQEIVLVFFTCAALAAGWRYTRRKGFLWALLAGLCVGLMHATKETCVIAWGSAVGAALLTALWSHQVDKVRLRLRGHIHHWHAIGALKIAAVVSVLCLTAFLSNPKATLDSVRTYLVYLDRGGSGDSSTNGMGVHNHPWHYYLHLLLYYRNSAGPFWSEALIVALAAVGAVRALLPRGGRSGRSAECGMRDAICDMQSAECRLRNADCGLWNAKNVIGGGNIHLLRILAFYTLLMTTIYSVIPYKTPWCLLGFLHGMILLAGVGMVALWNWLRRPAAAGAVRSVVLIAARILLVLALAAGCWHLGAQAWRGNSNRFDADPRNPYVYGHTSYNVLKLVKRAEALAEANGLGSKMLIRVMVPKDDHWPLPWSLRRFPYVGYYPNIHEAVKDSGAWVGLPSKDEIDAPLIITSPELVPYLEAFVKDDCDAKKIPHIEYVVEYYGLRPDVLLVAMIRTDIWNKFLAAQQVKTAEAKTK